MRGIPLFDLTRQHRQLRRPLEQALRQVLSTGRFILGLEVARFEEEFPRFCGVRYGVGVASGTDALELALRALGVGRGDKVLTVSLTFLSTVDAIRKVGAQPVFVDVDPVSATMNPEHLKRILGRLASSERRRIKGILPVHLYGHPCDMTALGGIARREGWWIVEDCAQAHGALWNSRKVGGFGEMGCFSFYPTKNLGACGDGGMVVTAKPALAQRLRILRFQGRKDKDHQIVEGLNSRLDELQAAILRVKLRYLNGWIRERRHLAALYTELLKDLPVKLPLELPGARQVYHLFCVQALRREKLRKALAARGISTAIHYRIPVHSQPLYQSRESCPLPLPVTEKISQQVLSLPLFPEMSPMEVKQVCKAVADFYRSNPRSA